MDKEEPEGDMPVAGEATIGHGILGIEAAEGAFGAMGAGIVKVVDTGMIP